QEAELAALLLRLGGLLTAGGGEDGLGVLLGAPGGGHLGGAHGGLVGGPATRGGQTARGLLRPREDVLAEPLSGDLGGLAGLLPGGGEVSLGVLLHTLGVLLGALDGLAGLLALLLRVLGGLLARVLGLLPQIVRAGGGLLADGAGLLGGGGLQRLRPVTADHRLLRQLVDHQMDLVRGGLSRLVGAHAPVLDLVVRLQHIPPALGELFPSCPQWALNPTAEEDAV